MISINPATEEQIARHEDFTPQQIESALKSAVEAFENWRCSALERRAELLVSAAGVLRRQLDQYARTITSEMGKPIDASRAEVEKCAAACEYVAQNGARWLAPQPVQTDADSSYIRYDPLGAVLAMMPWNFPFWQAFRFAAPALMAGNVGLLKHASNTTGCALAIEAIFMEAGFPPGVFQTLVIDDDTADRLIEHPVIAAASLTGSEKAGLAVAGFAARALKKTVLELDGSDPFLVLPPVNAARAGKMAAAARCINTGQSCIAAKRFIVHQRVADEFEQSLVSAMAQLKLGDPMLPGIEIGPLARLDLLEKLHDQVKRSVAAGAKLLLGGERVARKGFYYPPTVLSNVSPGMAAFDEETFGPVAAVIRAADEKQMIELANHTRFGLGASIWTDDLHLAQQLATRIESGNVFVNGPVKSDPALPFGGIKKSGWGRELGEAGIREFVNVKSVWVRGNG